MNDSRYSEPQPRLRIRPYALTRGRTRAAVDIPLETIVRVAPNAPASGRDIGPDERTILDLAAQPISLAELSAHLRMVIGVVRVLVGDLVAEGLLTRSAIQTTNQPDASILERVLNGLKAL